MSSALRLQKLIVRYVTHLKISFNPFAKAFKKGKETAEDKPKKRARAIGFDPTVAHSPYSSHSHNVPPMPAWMPFQHLHNHQVQMAGGGQYGPSAELVCRSGGPQFHHHTHQHVHVAPTLRPTVSINVNHQYLEGCPDHALHPQFPFVQEMPHYPDKSIARKRQKVHAVAGSTVTDGELASPDLSTAEGESSYMADNAGHPMRTDSSQNPSPDVGKFQVITVWLEVSNLLAAHWTAEAQAAESCRVRPWSASPYASGSSEGPADEAVYRSVNSAHAQKMYPSVLDNQTSTFNDPRSSCPPGSPDLSNPNHVGHSAPNLHPNYSTYSPESYANNTPMYHNYEYVYGGQQQISHTQDMYNSQQYAPQQQLGQMSIHPQ
ncbi:hypothetical protein FHG87_010079 [Trinorchestia longiramus]|nr:hypothetical protein FHG87_010079 [Trinorchestia longiramus]